MPDDIPKLERRPMTREHVSNFVTELVTMAEATKRVPELETELQMAYHELNQSQEQIQRLELKAIGRKAEIDELHRKLRDAEVARDDAELRFLECDDAKSTLQRVLQGIIGEATGVIKAITPEVVTSVIEKAVETEVQVPLAGGEATAVGAETPSVETAQSPHVASQTHVAFTEGQSATDPTGGETHNASPNTSGSVFPDPTAHASATDGSHSAPSGASTDADVGSVPSHPTSNASTQKDELSGSAADTVTHVDDVGVRPKPTEDSEWQGYFGRQSHAS